MEVNNRQTMSEVPTSSKGRFASLYEDIYEGASDWRELGAVDKAKNIVDLCSTVAHERILEVGAGDGSILHRLGQLSFGTSLTALESSRSAVQTIRRRKIPGIVDAVEYDGRNFPFPSAYFDLAIISHVLEHAEDPRRVLAEARRVAQYVFVEVPAEDTVKLEWNHHDAEKLGHINFYSPTTIRRLCQTCGLEVIDQKLTSPSRAVYRALSKEPVATAKYCIKIIGLHLMPRVVSCFWTYHAALVMRSGPVSGVPEDCTSS